jgi:hypothetical protein
MTDLLAIDKQEMITELEREIAARQRVYPRLVANNAMAQRTMDRRIEILRAVIDLLDEKG